MSGSVQVKANRGCECEWCRGIVKKASLRPNTMKWSVSGGICERRV